MHPNKLEKIFDYYIGIPLCIFLGGCKGRGGVRNPPPRRILLIQISAIGDTILTIPTVRAIRRHLPNTHLAMITSGMGLQYLEHCPYLDQHIPLRLDALIQSP